MVTDVIPVPGTSEVESRHIFNDIPQIRGENQLKFYNEKQVSPYDGKQIAPTSGKQVHLDGGKQVVEHDVRSESFAKENYPTQGADHHHGPAIRHSRTRWIVLCGFLALIVVLSVILGPVLGLRHKGSEKDSQTSSPTTSITSSPTLPTTTLPDPLFKRNIAAISYESDKPSSQPVNASRVYFQDNSGRLLQASNSADNTSWTLSKTPATPRNGSAIGAAVSRPGYPLEFIVVYLNESNVIHSITYLESNGKWLSDVISDEGYTALPNSSIAVMYDQCSRCSNNTIIAFQDENGAVQIGNQTLEGWTKSQLGTALNPVVGTGLALQPFYRSGQQDQINLYHQKSSLNLSLASWHPASEAENIVTAWSLSTQVYDVVAPGSEIAAASSYTNISSGFEDWIEVLSISGRGVQVETWSGAINDWLLHSARPSAMANMSSNGKIYESVAVTATGCAFAAVRQDGRSDQIQYWQVDDNLVDWTLVGNVDTGDAWG